MVGPIGPATWNTTDTIDHINQMIRLAFDDPHDALDRARSFVNRQMKPDPHQSKYYRMWIDLLSQEPREIARRLLTDSPEGELLRDTMPVFHVASLEERLAILKLANSENYQIVVAM